MLLDVLEVPIIGFIGLRAEFIDHRVAPFTHFIAPWSKFSYTKATTYIFRSKTYACTIFVKHSEVIRTCPYPHVGYVAVVRILLEVVLHVFLYYRVG